METQIPVSVSGIWLLREGDRIKVLAEFDGAWHEVMSEFEYINFSHIVEPSGMRQGAIPAWSTRMEQGHR